MNLSQIRKEYTKQPLRRSDLAADPFVQFRLWMDEACRAGLIEPNAMSLATVDSAGQPWTRTVLLKGLSQSGFLFFTNYKSRKAKQIGINARVSLLFPWLALERQVSINGIAQKIAPIDSWRYFCSRPEGSQIGAWASPQSQVISARRLLEIKWAEMKRSFAKGKIPLPDFWGGYRVVPNIFEFWQGGQSRIHDRFLYTQKDDGIWHIDRLAP